MVMRSSIVHPNEAGRVITRRVAELPSLRYGIIGTKTVNTGPLIFSSGQIPKAPKLNDKPVRPPRRVRFSLPLTDGGDADVERVAGVERRSRASLHLETVGHGVNTRDSRVLDVFNCGISVPVTASPGVRTRVHPTGRYIKGTLSPTTNTGPNAAASPGGRALLRAAQNGEDNLLQDLLRRSVLAGLPEADLNATDSSGRTILSYVASNGSLELLEQLLQLPGLDPNKPDNEGNTALHFAAQAGQVECLNCLISQCRGIEIDARNDLGFTPLMKAALQGRNKCAKLLLFAGQ